MTEIEPPQASRQGSGTGGIAASSVSVIGIVFGNAGGAWQLKPSMCDRLHSLGWHAEGVPVAAQLLAGEKLSYELGVHACMVAKQSMHALQNNMVPASAVQQQLRTDECEGVTCTWAAMLAWRPVSCCNLAVRPLWSFRAPCWNSTACRSSSCNATCPQTACWLPLWEQRVLPLVHLICVQSLAHRHQVPREPPIPVCFWRLPRTALLLNLQADTAGQLGADAPR